MFFTSGSFEDFVSQVFGLFYAWIATMVRTQHYPNLGSLGSSGVAAAMTRKKNHGIAVCECVVVPQNYICWSWMMTISNIKWAKMRMDHVAAVSEVIFEVTLLWIAAGSSPKMEEKQNDKKGGNKVFFD